MTEIVLSLVIFLLLGVIVWLIRENHTQQKRLIKAILSKDLTDFTMSELAEQPVSKQKEVDPDLTPLSELDDEQFTKMIKKQAQG